MTRRVLYTYRLRVLCECGMRPCGWGGGGGDGGGGDSQKRASSGGTAATITGCRLMMTVEDEDGGGSLVRLQKKALECQRVSGMLPIIMLLLYRLQC